MEAIIRRRNEFFHESQPLEQNLSPQPMETDPAATHEELLNLRQNHESQPVEQNPSHQPMQAAVVLPKPAATIEDLLNICQNCTEEIVKLMAAECKAMKRGSIMTKAMQLIMEKGLAEQFSLTGKSTKKGVTKRALMNSPAYDLLKRILGKSGFAHLEETKLKNALKRTFNNIEDWDDGRVKRRKKEDRGEAPSTSHDGGRSVSSQNSDYDRQTYIDQVFERFKFDGEASLLKVEVVKLLTRQLDCFSQCRNVTDVMRTIEVMKAEMEVSPQYEPQDVSRLVTEAKNNSCYIQAMAFNVCFAHMVSLTSDANEGVERKLDCSIECSSIVLQHSRMDEFACDVGIKIMHSMHDEIISVENGDPVHKAKFGAWCLKNIGLSYNDLKNYDKAKEYFEHGLRIMNKQFGSNSSTYEIFSRLLSELGRVNVKLGNHCDAMRLCDRAIVASEQVEDWEYESKQEIIDGAVRICLGIGCRYNELENYDKAKEYFERGFRIMNKKFGSASSKYEVFSHLLLELGHVNSHLGNYYDAMKLCEQAIDGSELVEDSEFWSKQKIIDEAVRICLDIGCTCCEFKNYDEAKEYFECGFRIMNKKFGSDSSKYEVFSHLLLELGHVNGHLGNYCDAESLCEQAIDASELVEDWDYWNKQEIIDKAERLRNSIDKVR